MADIKGKTWDELAPEEKERIEAAEIALWGERFGGNAWWEIRHALWALHSIPDLFGERAIPRPDPKAVEIVLKRDGAKVRDFVFSAIEKGDGQALRDLGDLLDLTKRKVERARPSDPIQPGTLKDARKVATISCLARFAFFGARIPSKKELREAVEIERGESIEEPRFAEILRELNLGKILSRDRGKRSLH